VGQEMMLQGFMGGRDYIYLKEDQKILEEGG
jgi:hypothetical protein